MKNSDQLSHDPFCERQNNSGVHMVGVNIGANVTDISIIANFIERD